MSSSHSVVLFAYHYPPENVIGALRPARFVKYLKRLGYRTLVITAAAQPGHSPDTIYVPDSFVSSPGKGLGWNVDRIVRKLLQPGAVGVHWSGLAAQAAQDAIQRIGPSQVTIFSTFPPMGTHLAAWRMAKRTGFPWIADFRDPLAWPGLDQIASSWQRRLAQWLESRILHHADAIVANTDAAAAAWQQQHPKRRQAIQTIWNGFDPEERIAPLPIPPRTHKLLSHAGALYGGRTVKPLLESIDRLVNAGRLPATGIRIHLVGTVGKDVLPAPGLIERGSRAGWLELHPESIPQAEARQLTQTSDGLLLVQPHTLVQVPGKLFEYLQIGRPILAYVLPDSPIERILARSGVPFRCVYAGSPQPEFDAAVAGFFNLDSTPLSPNQWFEQNFSADRQTAALVEIIQNLRRKN